MSEKVWLTDTRTNLDKSLSMSPVDATKLANALLEAAKQASHTKTDRYLELDGPLPTLNIVVTGDGQESEIPLDTIPGHEGFDQRYCCAKCGGFLRLGWFGVVRGCINDQCENYFMNFKQ